MSFSVLPPDTMYAMALLKSGTFFHIARSTPFVAPMASLLSSAISRATLHSLTATH